jgi:hypothetical protein
MLKIIIDIAVQDETVFKQIIMIIIFWNNADAAFLNVVADFDNVIILLIIKTLNESAIIMIELTVFEFIMKKQSVIN